MLNCGWSDYRSTPNELEGVVIGWGAPVFHCGGLGVILEQLDLEPIALYSTECEIPVDV